MLMTAARRLGPDADTRRARYTPPAERLAISLTSVLDTVGRGQLTLKQLDLLRSDKTETGEDVVLQYAGRLDLLRKRCVSIVGTRDATENGLARAKRLSRELVEADIVVVSGLARGIDFAAHTSAISSGGATIAVIGTPLSKAYPAENAHLQEKIWNDHLLISPFAEGSTVFKSNFPVRNRSHGCLIRCHGDRGGVRHVGNVASSGRMSTAWALAVYHARSRGRSFAQLAKEICRKTERCNFNGDSGHH